MKRLTCKKAFVACLAAVMLFTGCAKNKPESTSPIKNDPAVKTEIDLKAVENKIYD